MNRQYLLSSAVQVRQAITEFRVLYFCRFMYITFSFQFVGNEKNGIFLSQKIPAIRYQEFIKYKSMQPSIPPIGRCLSFSKCRPMGGIDGCILLLNERLTVLSPSYSVTYGDYPISAYISGWLAVVLTCRLLTQCPLIHNKPHLHYHQHPVYSH